MSDDFDKLDIIDPDNIRYGEEKEFSHEQKVSMAYDQVLKSLCRENIKGYWQERLDRKGNILKEWKSDTREEKINSVMTLKHTLIAEIEGDDNFKIMVESKLAEIKTAEENAVDDEDKWFNRLPINKKGAVQHCKGYLNQDFIFYQNAINEKVRRCEELFEILEKLLAKFSYLKKKAKVY